MILYYIIYYIIYYVLLYYIILFYFILFYILFYYIILYYNYIYIILYYIIYYIILYYIILYYIMLNHIILYYIILYYIYILYYIIYIYYYILPVVTPKGLFTCPAHTDSPFPTPWRPQKARGAQKHIHGAAQVALIRGGGLGSGTQNRQALPGFVASVHQVLPELLVPQGFLNHLNDLNSTLVQQDLVVRSVWWLL